MAYNPTTGAYEKDSANQSEAQRVQAALQYYKTNNMNDKLASAQNYWNTGNNGSPFAYDAGTGANDVDRTKQAINFYNTVGMTGAANSAQNYLSGLNTPDYGSVSLTDNNFTVKPRAQDVKQYYVPGQQSLEDAIAKLNFTPKSFSQAQSEAANLANIQIDPQKTQLQVSLQKAIADAQNQKNSITANYSTVQTTADRMLEEAAKRATKSAAARGMGRSGAVEYERQQYSAPIMEQVMGAENQKAAQLTNVDNSLATVNESYNTQIQALEAQRGQLIAAQIAAITSGDQEKALQYAQARVSAEYNLAALLDSRDRYNQEAVRADTALAGIAGGGSPLQAIVPLRDYLVQNGISSSSITGDANQVNINGKSYTKSALEGAGAYYDTSDNHWKIPESVVRTLL